MKAAVLGASGFVGAAVTDALFRSSITVIPVAAPRIVAGSQMTPESWLADEAAGAAMSELVQALAGADVVVNCAGLATPGAPASAALYGANALLPSVVHQAARRAGIPRMVHLSSAAVQGDRAVLDETENRAPCTPYGVAKGDGERLLLARARVGPAVTVLRPTSVHGPGRATSASLARLARSRLSSVAGMGSRHSPQVLVQNVGYCVGLLLAEGLDLPPIVLQPSEGHTTRSVLKVLGMGREPVHVPAPFARAFLASAHLADHSGHMTATRRRLSMLWLGQEQVPGWFYERGFVPVAGRPAWDELALTLASEQPASHQADRGQVTK